MHCETSPEVEAWRVELESRGGREMLDIRLWTWDLDGRWWPSAYGISIPFDELLPELERAVGPQRLYGGDPAAGFLEACARAERRGRHLRRVRRPATTKPSRRATPATKRELVRA